MRSNSCQITKEAIELVFYKEMTHVQVAEHLGISIVPNQELDMPTKDKRRFVE